MLKPCEHAFNLEPATDIEGFRGNKVAGIPRKGRRGDGDPSTEAKLGLDLLDQEVNWTKIAVTL